MGVIDITPGDTEGRIAVGTAADSPAGERGSTQTLFAPERRLAITRRAVAQGRVAVAELAERFCVAPETIRRDLDALEKEGRIQRVHGGAIPPTRRTTVEPTARDRRTTHSTAKAAIARAAMAHLPGAHGSVLLDGGTTTAALAAQIAAAGEHPRGLDPLTVVTNSPSSGVELAKAHAVEVLLLGGRLRDVTETVVGATTISLLSNISADVVFLGANGVSAALGLTTPDPDEAAAKRIMVARSQRVILLADSSKFGEEHLCTFAELPDVDVLITDAAPPPPLAAALAAARIEVVVA